MTIDTLLMNVIKYHEPLILMLEQYFRLDDALCFIRSSFRAYPYLG
ncbi:MAG: hypothetical protein QM652_10180 [Legionella sp.]